MKTDELISLLAADNAGIKPLGRGLRIGLFVGGGLSLLLMLVTVGVRHDVGTALETVRPVFKIAVTHVLALAAVWLAFRIGRPGVSKRAPLLALAVPALMMLAAVFTEMAVSPMESWRSKMVGQHAAFCLFYIPVLSLAPLAGFLMALKRGAPDNPGQAGAVAGLASASIAAAIYAWHCPDDSPLFAAVWYVLAMALVVTAGWLAGGRMLRW